MAVEEDSGERHMRNPDIQSIGATRNLGQNWGHVEYQVESEYRSLSCVTAGPGAIKLLSSEVSDPWWGFLVDHGPLPLEMLLGEDNGDECHESLTVVLKAVI